MTNIQSVFSSVCARVSELDSSNCKKQGVHEHTLLSVEYYHGNF